MTETGAGRTLEYRPVTRERWEDFERVMGPRGAWGGCWCTWWRLSAAEFEKTRGEEARKTMKGIVAEGRVPGLLAYVDGAPVGWCSVAPREAFPRLNRSPLLKPVDDTAVWSIVCFYVPREYRGSGVAQGLLEAAVAYARSQGASVVEGYPIEPREGGHPPVAAWTGVPVMFERAGFQEVLRRKPNRPIVRKVLRDEGA